MGSANPHPATEGPGRGRTAFESAVFPPQPEPHIYLSNPWKGEHVLAFLRQALPGRAGRPRIVVLDNAGIHRSRTVREARRELAKRGLWLWYLPLPARN